eukprot:COSAG01_NODE_71815_length_254_cov_2.812903_1_plen_53_part_10
MCPTAVADADADADAGAGAAGTFAKRGFQQLSFPDVAFAPKYYARCGFRSYSL